METIDGQREFRLPRAGEIAASRSPLLGDGGIDLGKAAGAREGYARLHVAEHLAHLRRHVRIRLRTAAGLPVAELVANARDLSGEASVRRAAARLQIRRALPPRALGARRIHARVPSRRAERRTGGHASADGLALGGSQGHRVVSPSPRGSHTSASQVAARLS